MSSRPDSAHRPQRAGRTRLTLAVALASLLASLLVGVAGSETAHAGIGDTVDGRFSSIGIRAAGSVLRLDVTGRGGTPTNPEAVALNITATQASKGGYATIYPCGSARPAASTINFTPGITVANGIIAKVGNNGEVCVYTHQRTHLVIDVTGYFPAGSDYAPLNPARLLETRGGNPTVDGRLAGTGIRGAGTTTRVDVTGRGGTPTNPEAVALNITATQASKGGYATIYPCGSARPAASTINFTPGITVANGIIAKVGNNGEVCVYTHQRTHLVIDVTGYFPAGSDYAPLNPARLLDSRTEAPPIPEAAAHSLFLLNQLRASYGRAPVVYDAGMSNTALSWSAEMSRSGFRHSGSGFAENIAWHSLATMSPTTAAATLHNMWVGSSGHLANMISASYTRVGIGLHLDGSGWYGTHMFS